MSKLDELTALVKKLICQVFLMENLVALMATAIEEKDHSAITDYLTILRKHFRSPDFDYDNMSGLIQVIDAFPILEIQIRDSK